MPIVEFTRVGDRSIGDLTAEIRDWLEWAGIQAAEIDAIILHGRVAFRVTFDRRADADRFAEEFPIWSRTADFEGRGFAE